MLINIPNQFEVVTKILNDGNSAANYENSEARRRSPSPGILHFISFRMTLFNWDGFRLSLTEILINVLSKGCYQPLGKNNLVCRFYMMHNLFWETGCLYADHQET